MKHLQGPETKPNNKNTKNTKNHLIMQQLDNLYIINIILSISGYQLIRCNQ